jgi:probable HAF family extracellular repeat protein
VFPEIEILGKCTSQEEEIVKSRKCMSAIAFALFATLVLPIPLAAQQARYKLIDIPTLGGPTAYQSASAPGYQMLNNAGLVAGWADSSTADPFAPFCFGNDGLCLVTHALRWQRGVLTDLGALPGVSSSAASAINARGWIAGDSENGDIDPVTGGPQGHAVLWRDDEISDLGTLGGYESFSVDINSAGTVIGVSTFDAVPDPFSFLGASLRPFLWEKGVMQDLGTLGGPDALALSVNERGQVAGISFTNATANDTTGMPTQEPFLWEHGRMISLGTFGGTAGGPGLQGSIKINSRGQIIGTSNLAGDAATHPFVWENGVLTDLGTLGGVNAFAVWINDAGEIVGEADLPGSALTHLHHAFLWKNGVMKDLGTLGSTSHAEAVNSRGQVVGRSRLGDPSTVLQHAFLSEDGGAMIDLNTLIPANSTLQLIDAVNINERGEILGIGLPPGVQAVEGDVGGHLFLLIPCNAQDVSACQNSDASTTAAAQSHPAPLAATNPITSPQHHSTASEGIAAWRARLAQRYHIPGLAASPSD